MRVLVIGGGGREHALAWKLAQSPHVAEVLVAPGNPGTASLARARNVAVAADDVEGLCALAAREQVDLVVVGPEVPLALGVADRLAAQKIPCFGPTRAASELEHSKAYAKAFMERHGICTAASTTVDTVAHAQSVLAGCALPVVIKADGLAAGKGVVVASTREEALEAVRAMLEGGRFGAAGQRVVIEEFLEGQELSFIALVAGGRILPLATARDHKRRDDGDRGPNTGGMGVYSPVPETRHLEDRILSEVMEPVVAGLAQEGRPYTGFLYAGLMIQQDRIAVLEFNCRLGDPETQAILPRLRSDLALLLHAAVHGHLGQQRIEWDPRVAVTVVLAAAGYPDACVQGVPIRGLDRIRPQVPVFHAGTRLREDGQLVSHGGRVLCVGALGDSLEAARREAYAVLDQIEMEGGFCRRDIGLRVSSGAHAV